VGDKKGFNKSSDLTAIILSCIEDNISNTILEDKKPEVLSYYSSNKNSLSSICFPLIFHRKLFFFLKKFYNIYISLKVSTLLKFFTYVNGINSLGIITKTAGSKKFRKIRA